MFSKKEAAKMLGVSMRTLDRHISAGKIAVERTEAQNFQQSVTISLEAMGAYLRISDEGQMRQRLGLPRDTSTVSHATEPSLAESDRDTEPSGPSPSRPALPSLAQRVIDDADFAERFRAGEVPDSAGNYIDGRNARWSEPVTLLGPGIPPAPRPDCNAHINPALLSDSNSDGITADSPEHPLNAGFKGIEVRRPAHPNRTRMVGLSRAMLVRFI